MTNPVETNAARLADDARAGLAELPAPPAADAVLTARESVFATHYAESRNVMAAYRASHDVGPNAKSSSIYTAACHVLRRDHVLKAVRSKQDELNTANIARAQDILRDLVDIYDADPNELIKLERFNCRHCHGVDYAFQWRDHIELAHAVDAYARDLAAFVAFVPVRGAKRPPRPVQPHAAGGFGFKLKADPAPECPHCYGQGLAREMVQDTTKLSPKARKLYAGIEVKPDGSVKVLMHDQMKARDMAIKMLGAYKADDARGLNGKVPDLAPPSETISPEEMQRAYLKLL